VVKEPAVNLVHTFNEFGNPFLENSSELLVLDTRNVKDQSVVNTVNTIYEVGKEQYANYYKDVAYIQFMIPSRKILYLSLDALTPKLKANTLKRSLW